jgi:nucleoside-diphosphate-sugar epimerase
MKILFIGGTGLISSACSDLAAKRGMELYVLNRGVSKKRPLPESATLLQGDINKDENAISKLLADHHFDAVVDWIAFTRVDIERDVRLFRGKTGQFVFISSASVYQKPPQHYIVTEETPLENPFWDYSQNKIACEERLWQAYRQDGFPVTIVRPSLTYGPSQIPLAMGSWEHPYSSVDRMKRGQKVIVHGDGTSLWVFTWNEDFAKGFLGLLGNKAAIGEDFHITSDEVLTWNQAHEEVGRALGVEPHLVHIPSDYLAAFDEHKRGSLIGDKANSLVFDNSKIKRFVPDFECPVPFSEGVRKALSWFEANPDRQTIDHEAGQHWDRIIAAYEKAFPGM